MGNSWELLLMHTLQEQQYFMWKYTKNTLSKMCEMYGYTVFFMIFICVCVCSLQMTQLLQCAMTVEDQCLSWRSGKWTFNVLEKV